MAITRAQPGNVTAGSPASVTSVTCALSSAVTAGNLLIAYVYVYPTQAATLTDTQGNTWSAATTQAVDGAIASGLQIFYAIAKSSGSNTVTLSIATAGTGIGLALEEYATSTGALALDVGAAGSDQQTTTPSISLTTTTANELMIAAMIEEASGTVSAGSGFSLGVSSTSKWWEKTEYQLDTGAAGSKTAAFTISADAHSSMVAAAFKVTAAAAGFHARHYYDMIGRAA